MKKRLFSVVMICCMILSIMPTFVYAAQPPQVETQWDNAMGVNANISFNGTSGRVSVSVVGRTGVTNISAQVKLYYKNTSGGWTESPTDWTYNVYTMLLTKEETFTGIVGREYKIELTANIYKNGYTETVTDTATAVCTTSS